MNGKAITDREVIKENRRSMHLDFKGNRQFTVLTILLSVLVACMIVSVAFGSVSIPLLDVIKMLLNKIGIFNFHQSWKASYETIIFNIRLPIVVGGMLVGAALSVAGVLFQGLFRNPLADPYIVGTSAGAAFGATIAMVLPISVTFLDFGVMPIFAFLGALAAVMLVYSLARVGGKTPVVSMLLAGFVISSMLMAAIFLLLVLVGDERNLTDIFMFLMGSLSVNSWEQLGVIALLIVCGITAARVFFAHHLNAFALGEEGAAYVGIDVERYKIYILALGSLLTAAAISISGLIGFVGLLIPHTMRLILGPEHRLLLPASALAGGSFLVLADLLARTLPSAGVIPIGTITAPLGGLVFIYLLRRNIREYAF